MEEAAEAFSTTFLETHSMNRLFMDLSEKRMVSRLLLMESFLPGGVLFLA